MTSRLLCGPVVGGPPSWPWVPAGPPAASAGDVGVGDVGVDRWDSWVDREFEAIVAANWPVQDQPVRRRRRTRVGALAAPRQPDNRGRLTPGLGDSGSPAGQVVDVPSRVESRERSPPPSTLEPRAQSRRTENMIEKCGRENRRRKVVISLRGARWCAGGSSALTSDRAAGRGHAEAVATASGRRVRVGTGPGRQLHDARRPASAPPGSTWTDQPY